MNREIKFRAWDGYKMFHVDQITFNDGIWDISKGQGVSILTQPHIILMQFTGLKDKNGKEIYEGDVLQWAESKVVIKFQDGAFGFNDDSEIHLGFCFLIGINLNSEVIGNIYSNPDLVSK